MIFTIEIGMQNVKKILFIKLNEYYKMEKLLVSSLLYSFFQYIPILSNSYE